MNRSIIKNKYAMFGVCVLITILLAGCNAEETTLVEKFSTAPAEWFSDSGIPEPKPGEFKSSSNLEFHQISWQYFLWLTEEVGNGKLRFETMFNDASINPDSKNPTNQILGGVQQADSYGILVDKNGRAVYTTLIINDVYRNWVIENKLYDHEELLNFPDTLNFPVGSFSLKAAWKIVEEGEDVSNFYTTRAEIQLLANENGKVVIPANPKTEKNVKVALIAFHIAVVVKGHPEFIWATFEHVDNAPNFKDRQKMNDPVSEKNYTFYDAGTLAEDCNNNNANIIKLNESTQKLSPVTQVALQYRVGGGDSTNQSNIDSLNKAVHSQLEDNSVWKNYMEVGAIWFLNKDNLIPDWTPNTDPDRITGSIKLSNSAIETFTQDSRSQNECFSCHNTMAVTQGSPILPGKNVSTSHILLKKYLDGTLVKRN